MGLRIFKNRLRKISKFMQERWGKHRHLDITNSFWQQVTARRIRVRKRDKVIVFVCCYCTNGIFVQTVIVFVYWYCANTNKTFGPALVVFSNFNKKNLLLFSLVVKASFKLKKLIIHMKKGNTTQQHFWSIVLLYF